MYRDRWQIGIYLYNKLLYYLQTQMKQLILGALIGALLTSTGWILASQYGVISTQNPLTTKNVAEVYQSMHILAKDVSAVMSQGKEDCTVTVVEECTPKPVEPFCGDAIINQPREECDWASSAPDGYRCNVCKLVKIDEPKKETPKTNKPKYVPLLPPTGAGSGMRKFVPIKSIIKK